MRRLMLQNTFKNFLVQIQPGKLRRVFRKDCDDPMRLDVVFKRSSVFFYPPVECLFAGVAEGRMAEVMTERDAFGEIFIESERPCEVAADLGDFHGVGEARTHVVVRSRHKHLRLPLQSSKSLRVNDAITVALKGEAGLILWFRVDPAENAFMGDGVGGEESVCSLYAVAECLHIVSVAMVPWLHC